MVSTTSAARTISSMPKPGSTWSSLLGEEAHEGLLAAEGTAGADGEGPPVAVDTMADEVQTARALAGAAQRPAEIVQEAVDCRADVRRRRDRLGEGAAGLARGQGTQRHDRFVDLAQGLLEPPDGLRAEAPDQFDGLDGEQGADSVQSEGDQRFRHIGTESQRGHGQLGQRTFQLVGAGAGGHHGRVLGAVTGQRPGRAGRVGEGQPHGQAEAFERAPQRRHQRFLAAEETGAAGDVEEKRVGAVGHDARGEAVGPAREALQREGVGGGVGGADDHAGHDGAPVGQGHAGGEAGPRGAGVGRVDDQPVVALGDGDEGVAACLGTAPGESLAGPPGEPGGEDAPGDVRTR